MAKSTSTPTSPSGSQPEPSQTNELREDRIVDLYLADSRLLEERVKNPFPRKGAAES